MMKKIFIFILIFLVVSCTRANQEMSKIDYELVKTILVDGDLTQVDTTLSMLNSRIKQFHKKTDYLFKVQILLELGKWEDAFSCSSESLEYYPDYLEIKTLQAVLALFLKKSEAIQYYQNVIMDYEQFLITAQTDDDKYKQLINMLLISKVFCVESQVEYYSKKIENLSNYNQTIPLSYLKSLTKQESFAIFGINEY